MVKSSLLYTLNKAKHIEYTTKTTKADEESICMMCDGNNDGSISSTSFQDLKLRKYNGDEEKTIETNKATTQSHSRHLESTWRCN